MQIVIEISSYDKEWITNGYYIPEEINMRISEAIANGIPLPEGHGDLIDRNQLYDDFWTSSFDWYYTIEYADVIIPADESNNSQKEGDK